MGSSKRHKTVNQRIGKCSHIAGGSGAHIDHAYCDCKKIFDAVVELANE